MFLFLLASMGQTLYLKNALGESLGAFGQCVEARFEKLEDRCAQTEVDVARVARVTHPGAFPPKKACLKKEETNKKNMTCLNKKSAE